MLLLYVWCEVAWLSRYAVPHTEAAEKLGGRLLRFHAPSLVWAAGLLLAAVLYKKLLSGDPEGFPWYWTYLLLAAFLPSAGFFRATRRFINWRAFGFTFLLVLLISLTWEASLASPYGWWGYQHDAMMGLYVTAWNHLPIEADFVWLAVTYTTVIVYQVVKLWQASGKGLKAALLGE